MIKAFTLCILLVGILYNNEIIQYHISDLLYLWSIIIIHILIMHKITVTFN